MHQRLSNQGDIRPTTKDPGTLWSRVFRNMGSVNNFMLGWGKNADLSWYLCSRNLNRKFNNVLPQLKENDCIEFLTVCSIYKPVEQGSN